MKAPSQAQAVAARTEVGWFAKPVRCSEANSQSPERSPVNTRPVRLPPCAAGASPSTYTRASRVAEARHGPAPVVLVAERGPLLARDPLAPLDEARAARGSDD